MDGRGNRVKTTKLLGNEHRESDESLQSGDVSSGPLCTFRERMSRERRSDSIPFLPIYK